MPPKQRDPRREVFNLLDDTASLATKTKEQKIPYKAKIAEVAHHFPGGCESLVYHAIEQKGEQIYPARRGDPIALDGDTVHFKNLNIPFDHKTNLQMVIRNYDGTYSHKTSIMMVIEEIMDDR